MRQIRNVRRFVVVLGMLALLVSLTTAVVATSILVDGNGSEWAASDYQGSDAAEAEVPDQYDIVPVYATTDDGNGMFCIRYDTEGDLYLNGGSYTEIYFDLDGDSTTGATQMCQSGFGDVGAERYVYWVMGSLDMCAIFEWNSGWQLVSMDCNGEPHGADPNGGASVEVCANAQDLGMAGDVLPTVKVFFENGDASEPPPPDDIFCFNYSPGPPPGTGTPGYWKNHPEAWPVEEITIGGVTYSKADAIANMQHPTRKDKTYSMFQALVAAKLNVLVGNDDSCVDIDAADDWMLANPLGSGVRGSSDAWKAGEPLHEQLDAYNNGLLPCAEHRD